MIFEDLVFLGKVPCRIHSTSNSVKLNKDIDYVRTKRDPVALVDPSQRCEWATSTAGRSLVLVVLVVYSFGLPGGIRQVHGTTTEDRRGLPNPVCSPPRTVSPRFHRSEDLSFKTES